MGGGSFYGFVFGLDIPSNVTISGMNKVHMRFHKDNTTKLQCVVVPLCTMVAMLAMLLGFLYLFALITKVGANLLKICKEGKVGIVSKLFDDEDSKMEEGITRVAAELLDLQWVLPYAFVCGWLAGVEAVYMNDTNLSCAPFELTKDTGLKYMGTLLSFLILFRFHQLYGRVVAARGDLEALVAALRQLAVHLRGMASPNKKARLWAENEDLRIEMGRRLVYMYALQVFTLRGNWIPSPELESDDPAVPTFKALRDTYSDAAFNAINLTDRAHLKSLLIEEATLLNVNLQQMVDRKMIVGTPAQYGHLVARVSDVVTFASATEAVMDIFPGHVPYPRLITFVSRMVLMYFCVCAAAVVGCNTLFPSYYIAQLYAFFISLAYCGLFELCSAMENPYGQDLMDFTLDHYGVSIAYDVGKILQLPPDKFPLFPVTDKRYPDLRNREMKTSHSYESVVKVHVQSMMDDWPKEA